MARAFSCGSSSMVSSLLTFVICVLVISTIFNTTSRNDHEKVQQDKHWNSYRAFPDRVDESNSDRNVETWVEQLQTDSVYPSDPSDNCTLDRKFMPEGSMPLIFLLSFPGSGNTWVRYLLERSSGIYSGSIYNDVGTGNTDDDIFRRSPVCSKSTIVIKAHTIASKPCKIDGAIIIVRNPYRAILAEFNRQHSNKTGTAPASAFKDSEWDRFAVAKATSWSSEIKSQLDSIPHRIIVFYENLVTHTDFEVRRMLEFLHVTPNEKRMQCLFHSISGDFKRKHKDLGFNPFSVAINETIDRKVANIRDIMDRNGYNLPPYES